MSSSLSLKTVFKLALSQTESSEILALCSQAFEEDYAPYLETFQATGRRAVQRSSFGGRKVTSRGRSRTAFAPSGWTSTSSSARRAGSPATLGMNGFHSG